MDNHFHFGSKAWFSLQSLCYLLKSVIFQVQVKDLNVLVDTTVELVTLRQPFVCSKICGYF